MGWEQRGNSNYDYKERAGARVRSVYVGNGEIAHNSSVYFAVLGEIRSMKSRETVEQERIDTLKWINSMIGSI
jgi:hypothetical protein